MGHQDRKNTAGNVFVGADTENKGSKIIPSYLKSQERGPLRLKVCLVVSELKTWLSIVHLNKISFFLEDPFEEQKRTENTKIYQASLAKVML